MIYPIKSLDGLSFMNVSVLKNGALVGDRAHYLEDREGKVFNAKRSDKIHLIRCRFSDDRRKVFLSFNGMPFKVFDLEADLERIHQCLSSVLGEWVWLKKAGPGGFPDDIDAPGCTLVSEASLYRVGEWFGLGFDEVLRRFRPNLVISGVEPFWEDQWLGEGEQDGLVLRLGGLELKALKACRRCVVPARSSLDGVKTLGFVECFTKNRSSELHPKALSSRFGMSYRLGINTVRTDTQAQSELGVGAEVFCSGKREGKKG